MIIRKSETTKEIISKKGTVLDYPMPSEELGISIQELNGRVPDSGWFMNKVCHEICFVISGSGTVFIGNKSYKISEGDVYIIKSNQKSYIHSENLKIVCITKPNFYSEQCEHTRD